MKTGPILIYLDVLILNIEIELGVLRDSLSCINENNPQEQIDVSMKISELQKELDVFKKYKKIWSEK